MCTDSLMGQSGNLQPHRFSAFWLRSKCSICSYQLNIWYGLHSRSRILNWFLTDWAYGWACSPGPAGRHGIALPPWVASFFFLVQPNYHIVVSTNLLCMVLGRFLSNSQFHLFFFVSFFQVLFEKTWIQNFLFLTQILFGGGSLKIEYDKWFQIQRFWSVTKWTLAVILTWLKGNCDHQGSSFRSRLHHCT